MKRTTWSSLANLAWIAILWSSLAEAQLPDYAVPELDRPAEAWASFRSAEPDDTTGALPEMSPDGPAPETEAGALGEGLWLDGTTGGASSAGPCCAVCGGGYCCPDNWYIGQDIRILTRSRPRRIPLTLEFQATTGLLAKTLSTRSFGFDMAAGYAATVGRYLGRDTDDRDQFVEFSYWGLNNWLESRSFNGERLTFNHTIDNPDFDPDDPDSDEPEQITVPFFEGGSLFSRFDSSVGGFNRADQHFVSYESDINNFELNVRLRPRGRPDRLVLHPSGRWRRECQPGAYMSYLFGLRVVSVDEMFGFHARGVIQDLDEDGNVVGGPEDVFADYVSLTHNDMFGLQVGGDYMFRSCKWAWGMRFKAGPFVNFSDAVNRAVTDAAADPFTATAVDYRRVARRDDAALVAEFGFVGTYKLRPNLIVRGAYDFMWITGLALAAEQLVFETDPPARLNNNGHIYYHGLSLGLELTW